MNEWLTYSVSFDPTWTDAEARAAGWLTDHDVYPNTDPSVSFSETMANVYTAEVRLSGEGFLEAGIDNYSSVPIPGTVFLLGGGLVGLAALRKKFWLKRQL